MQTRCWLSAQARPQPLTSASSTALSATTSCGNQTLLQSPPSTKLGQHPAECIPSSGGTSSTQQTITTKINRYETIPQTQSRKHSKTPNHESSNTRTPSPPPNLHRRRTCRQRFHRHQFSTRRSALHTQIVPLIDLRIAHSSRPSFFMLPVLVHKLAKFFGVPGLQGIPAAKPQLFDIVKIFQHFTVIFLGSHFLVLQNSPGTSGKSREK